jgi:hypothetical protein
MLIFPSQPEDLGGDMGAKKYQCQPALGSTRLVHEFLQNSDSTPTYYQRKDKKKMSHHKNLGQCKIIMIIGTLTTHQRVTRVALSSSSSSSRISTALPFGEKKYSNKETYKQ